MPQLIYPQERDPVPLCKGAGWTPGPVFTGAKNLALSRIRCPAHPAYSESLYQLSCPGPHWTISTVHKTQVCCKTTRQTSSSTAYLPNFVLYMALLVLLRGSIGL
jgi:hypothetical protein